MGEKKSGTNQALQAEMEALKADYQARIDERRQMMRQRRWREREMIAERESKGSGREW